MGRWNTTTVIGTVNFSECRATIIGGSQFATTKRGSIARAASGRPRVQIIGGFEQGWIPFGLQMDRAEAAMLDEALEEIRAAEDAATAIRVNAVDALYSIDVLALPDYNQEWFTHGAESEGIIEAVTFRFMGVAPYTAP